MPVALERKLKRKASKKGLKGDHKDAYVYGTLRKTGWKPDREKKLGAVLDELLQFDGRLTGMRQLVMPPKITKPRDIAQHMRETLRRFRKKHGLPLPQEDYLIQKAKQVKKIRPGIGLMPPRKYLLSEQLDDLINFGDPRPRNQWGQFSDENDGVADPNTMVRTYHSPGMSAVRPAIIGGASAGTAGAAVKAIIEKIRRSRARR